MSFSAPSCATGDAGVAAEVEEEAVAPVLVGDRLDLRLDVRRAVLADLAAACAFSSRDELREALAVERPVQLGEPQREQVHDRDLAEERLRRGDGDLEARRACKSTPSASRVACEPMTFVTASTVAPRSCAMRIAASVSAVSPDCVMPMTRSPGPTIGLR